jgi:circadian clock protein KaiC
MQEASRHAMVDPQAEGLVHGFVTLHQEAPSYGGQRRRLRVHKLRGSEFRDGYHDYKILRGGLAVFPRLVAAEHYETFPETPVASGVAEFDALLGGGPSRGSSLLLLGPAGVGKSSVASQYAVAAVERGERVATFLFDESIRAFLSRAQSLGIDLRGPAENGRLMLRQVDPAELSPGEFAHLARRAVEQEDAGVVIIDSLNGYLSAMPEERFLTTHLHELLMYLGYKHALTIFTLGQHGLVGEHLLPPVDVSYLADTVVLLRFFEAQGAVRRAVSVMKKRNGTHDAFIREMQISGRGIHVGQPLEAFHGVLSGRPVYTGETAHLAARKSADVSSERR